MGKPLKVLMVEDSEDDAALTLRELRRGGYEVLLQRVETRDGMAEALQHDDWDVIISDYSLPGFSGRAALHFYKEQKLDIPFIIVSGVIGEDTAVEMMKAGAHDYVLKGKLARLTPAVERELRETEIRREARRAEEDLRDSEDRFRSLVQNSIDVIIVHDGRMVISYESPSAAKILGYDPGYWIGKNPLESVHPDDYPRARKALEDLFQKDYGGDAYVEFRFRHASGRWLSLEVVGKNLTLHPRINGVVLTARDITARKEAEEELRNLNRALQVTTRSLEESNAELALSYDATLKGWADALELREKETAGHSQRVVSITLEICNQMGFTGEQMVHIRRGALLHDIGKMGIPDSVLLKPGPLSADEWVVMRQHPIYAYQLLVGIRFLQPALDIPYCHHERWDGSGYPRGLKGDDIPLEARIFAVVDVWDALLSDRPYRPPWPQADVVKYLNEQSGKQFDPDVVKVFLKYVSEVKLE